MLTNLNLTDMETCYKVFTRSALAGIVMNMAKASDASRRTSSSPRWKVLRWTMRSMADAICSRIARTRRPEGAFQLSSTR